MLSFIDFGNTNIIGVKIDGKITDEELDAIIGRFEEKLEHHEKVRLYAEMKSFDGMGLKAFFKDLKFGLKNLRRFEKEVVVTDKKWAREFAAISDPLFPTVEVKSFPFSQREKAKQWIRSA